MMKKSWSCLLLSALMLVSIRAFAQDPEELLEKIDRNLAPESFESYR